MSELRHVRQPFELNRLRARNRVFAPAHTINFGAAHLPTDRHVDYHRAAPGHTLIACIPPRGAHALEAPLIAIRVTPVLIGDCLGPRNAAEAVFEGHRLAPDAVSSMLGAIRERNWLAPSKDTKSLGANRPADE